MRTFLLVSSILWVLGCNNTPSSVDGGSLIVDGGHEIFDTGLDAGPRSDGGSDANASDAGSDATAAACSAVTCSGAHACVRGTCVLSCGADASGLDAALATGVTVVRSVCHTPVALDFAGGRMVELTTTTTGSDTEFALTSWMIDSEAPTVTAIGSAHFTGMTGDTTFPGGYVAMAPDGMHAVFGYTSSRMGVGGVFDMATGTGSATEVDAANNYDATFLDATHYVVNGAPSAGQGVYRATVDGTTFTRVVSNAGDVSGSVDLFGSSVLAGGLSFGAPWADGATSGDRVLVLDAAALGSASTPIDASTVTQLSMPSSFELLSDGRVATLHYDGSFQVDSVLVRTLSRAADGTVSVSAPTPLATGALFDMVAAAGTEIVLRFNGGLLFVR